MSFLSADAFTAYRPPKLEGATVVLCKTYACSVAHPYATIVGNNGSACVVNRVISTMYKIVHNGGKTEVGERWCDAVRKTIDRTIISIMSTRIECGMHEYTVEYTSD